MTVSFRYSDVNEAYSELQIIKKQFAEREHTRNGLALVFISPVLVTHLMPYRRVLFDPIRDANPFFHYMEALWMLGGRKNVSFPATFASNMLKYSDDGMTLHGAYGHRWRRHWKKDQIQDVIYMLNRDPSTRRAVIGMWDPATDLEVDSKDLPCNTHLYFRVQDNRLHMTICNRSNDLVWGMLGSNIVHFSILQEYIASAIAKPVGNLYQFTNNLHIYEDWVDKYTYRESSWYRDNPAFNRHAFSPATLDLIELDDFLDFENKVYYCPILRDNADFMLTAWRAYKDDRIHEAIHVADRIYDEDWRRACIDWLKRRLDGPNRGSQDVTMQQGRLSNQEISHNSRIG